MNSQGDDIGIPPVTEADGQLLVKQLIRALTASGWCRSVIDRWREDAAWFFHRCGVCWHELLLLQDIMDGFRAASPDTVSLAFYKRLTDITKGATPIVIARGSYEVAAALAPRHAETLYNIAALEFRAGNAERAFRLAAAAAHLPAAATLPAHAHLGANAHWLAGQALERVNREGDAVAYYSQAVASVGAFGPDQAALPQLLRRLGRYEEAAAAFEGLMTYSHRYAPEFIFPEEGAAGGWPVDWTSGTIVDPFAVRMVKAGSAGDSDVLFFAGAYFRVASGVIPHSGRCLIEAASPLQKWRIFRRRSDCRCAPTLADLVPR